MDTNIRVVKSSESGGFTTLTKAQKNSKVLCSYCAYLDCKIKNQLAKINNNIKLSLIDCKLYQFPLVFRDASGTEDYFNTFRVGRAWSKRLTDGLLVGLVDKEGSLFGRAKVEDVLLLPKSQALQEHAYKNHLMLNCLEKEAPEKLCKILRNSYGNLVYSRSEELSVIYLKRES